jgi:hypothetical protein
MNISRALGIIIAIVGIYLLFTYKQEPSLVSVLPQEAKNSNKESVIETVAESTIDTTNESVSEISIPRIPDRSICIGEYCDGHMNGGDNYTVVKVPLVTYGDEIGCGSKILMIPHVVEPKTQAILDTTYKTLFSLKSETDIKEDGVRNPVGLEQKLHYRGVVLKDGVAQVKLSGVTEILGECMIPEFRAQIEQAALQYASVQEVRVYANDKLWDWCDYSTADPSEDGCDKNPKYWITKK